MPACGHSILARCADAMSAVAGSLLHHLPGGSVHFAAAGFYQRRWVCLALMGQGEGKLLKRSLVEDQVARVSHTPLPVLKLSVWAKTTRVIREGQRIVVRGTLASIATTFWSPDCTTVHKILHVLNCMVFVFSLSKRHSWRRCQHVVFWPFCWQMWL